MTHLAGLVRALTGTTILGVRRSALVEMAMFFGVALTWDMSLGDGQRFASAAVHPFWAIVLLMCSFYGLREGLLAALASALIFRVGHLPSQQIDQHVYDYAWTTLRDPVLWTVVAVVLGEIREHHTRAEALIRQSLAVASARLDELTKAYRDLDTTRERLETRLVGQATTTVQLYQAVQNAQRLETGAVLDAAADVIRTALQPQAFSIFLLQGDALQRVLKEGWTTDAPWPHAYRAGSPLFDALVAGRQTLCAVQRADEQVLDGDGLLAGPLVVPTTSRVIGVLKIEQLRFVDLNFSSLQAFRAICEWIATAYDNAQRYERAQKEQTVDQQTQLLSMSYLKRQTAYLEGIAQRFGFDLTRLVLKVHDLAELTPEERIEVSAAIGDAARAVLRRTDLAFDYRREAGEFAVLMPGTPLHSGHIAGDKLLAALRQRVPRELHASIRIERLFSPSATHERRSADTATPAVGAVADDEDRDVA